MEGKGQKYEDELQVAVLNKGMCGGSGTRTTFAAAAACRWPLI